MIDNDKVGKEWQSKIEQKLKSLGLVVRLLDKGKKSCVDFYVHRKSSYQDGFLCEAKSVNVVGFDEDVKAQVSTRDKKFWNSIGDTKRIREHHYQHRRVENSIREQLSRAFTQYNNSDLSTNEIEKGQKPFVAAIGFDFTIFPNQVNFDRLLKEFPLISAVLVLNSMQDDAEFRVYKNKSAQVRFDKKFFHQSS